MGILLILGSLVLIAALAMMGRWRFQYHHSIYIKQFDASITLLGIGMLMLVVAACIY